MTRARRNAREKMLLAFACWPPKQRRYVQGLLRAVERECAERALIELTRQWNNGARGTDYEAVRAAILGGPHRAR